MEREIIETVRWVFYSDLSCHPLKATSESFKKNFENHTYKSCILISLLILLRTLYFPSFLSFLSPWMTCFKNILYIKISTNKCNLLFSSFNPADLCFSFLYKKEKKYYETSWKLWTELVEELMKGMVYFNSTLRHQSVRYHVVYIFISECRVYTLSFQLTLSSD